MWVELRVVCSLCLEGQYATSAWGLGSVCHLGLVVLQNVVSLLQETKEQERLKQERIAEYAAKKAKSMFVCFFFLGGGGGGDV